MAFFGRLWETDLNVDVISFLNGFYELSASQHWIGGPYSLWCPGDVLKSVAFAGCCRDGNVSTFDMVAFLFSVQRKLILQTFMWKMVRTQVGSNWRNNYVMIWFQESYGKIFKKTHLTQRPKKKVILESEKKLPPLRVPHQRSAAFAQRFLPKLEGRGARPLAKDRWED